MARGFYIQGEAMTYVKGPTGSAIASTVQLGLPADKIQCSIEPRYRDMNLDAFGGEIPPDVQCMLAAVNVTMDLIHFDPTILDECQRLSMGLAGIAGGVIGTLPHAGTRLGGGGALYTSATNNLMQLQIAAPAGSPALPWRFYAGYMPQAYTYPLGTEKSIVRVTWRFIPYPPSGDPWNSGNGAQGVVLWDRPTTTMNQSTGFA